MQWFQIETQYLLSFSGQQIIINYLLICILMMFPLKCFRSPHLTNSCEAFLTSVMTYSGEILLHIQSMAGTRSGASSVGSWLRFAEPA